MHKPFAALATASVVLLALAGCSSAAIDASGSGKIRVVASTNVYGSIATQIGGDRVDVTSIITSVAQDPHSYEASARDRLAVQKSDLVIENGGGYDSFMDLLLDDADEPEVVTAVEHSPAYTDADDHDGDHDADDADDHEDHDDHDHIEGFNEHVWFDPHTMINVVRAIADELTEVDPAGKATFEANAAKITSDLAGFESDLEKIKTDAAGAGVFITEPLPGYLAAAAGLTDVAPHGFAEAVEEGSDVAPSILLDAVKVIESGAARALLVNAQTGGGETDRVEQAAEAAGVPIVEFTELLEDGSSYAEWMRDAIKSLAAAVRS